jgi:hypothetical protein
MVHLPLEKSQIIPNHDDLVEKCLEPATVAAATAAPKFR